MTPGIQELMRQVEQVRDAFRRDVLAGDLDAALAACDRGVEVVHLPTGTGACGVEALRRFLADDVAGHLPADLAHVRVSRTVDRFRVVDEEQVGFTHDRPLPWLLPGVAPTGRAVRVSAVSVTTVRQGRIVLLRTHWDLASLRAQLGPAGAERPAPDATAGPGPAAWW